MFCLEYCVMRYLKLLANWDIHFHCSSFQWNCWMGKSPILHTVFLCDYLRTLYPPKWLLSDTANLLRKVSNLMHPNANSSNCLVKSYPPCLYISEGCKNHRKAIWVLCVSMSGDREGGTKQCWDGRSDMLKLSSAVCPQAQSHIGTGLLTSPHLSPGACSSRMCNQVLWNLYRANTKLTFVSCWKVFEEEKTPACLPGCLFPILYSKPLYSYATKCESEGKRNKTILDGKSE